MTAMEKAKETTQMEGKKERVIRVQKLEVEYMSSLAWFRLMVQMKTADPHGTYLSPAQHLETENQA